MDIQCKWIGGNPPPHDKRKPGEMYHIYKDYHDHTCPWDNCAGYEEHIIVEMPGGGVWDINSRASNCDMPDDKTHRCWIRHGDPPNITIDKNGNTCGAGAGSIQHGEYHGFLRNGKLVPA